MATCLQGEEAEVPTSSAAKGLDIDDEHEVQETSPNGGRVGPSLDAVGAESPKDKCEPASMSKRSKQRARRAAKQAEVSHPELSRPTSAPCRWQEEGRQGAAEAAAVLEVGSGREAAAEVATVPELVDKLKRRLHRTLDAKPIPVLAGILGLAPDSHPWPMDYEYLGCVAGINDDDGNIEWHNEYVRLCAHRNCDPDVGLPKNILLELIDLDANDPSPEPPTSFFELALRRALARSPEWFHGPAVEALREIAAETSRRDELTQLAPSVVRKVQGEAKASRKHKKAR